MMNKKTNKVAKFILGIALATSGFIVGEMSLSQEAAAAPLCTGNGGPSEYWGFRCVDGDCAIACLAANGPAYTTCAEFGATCLMGSLCQPLCPQ